MTPPAAPSLFGTGAIATPARFASNRQSNSLLDLMYDGFYLLFLLKDGDAPGDASAFMAKILDFLAEFEHEAKKLQLPADDIDAAKYAFCAALDETVLTSQFEARIAWQRQPLQLKFFGDQVAGVNFFLRLEELRQRGSSHLQALEVFHMCLLLGFRGKYLLESTEKLNYITKALGDEIAHLKGKRAAFAPHWKPPDQIAHALKTELPVWVVAVVFGLLALLAFLTLHWHLRRTTEQTLTSYTDVIKLAPRAAHLTITLP